MRYSICQLMMTCNDRKERCACNRYYVTCVEVKWPERLSFVFSNIVLVQEVLNFRHSLTAKYSVNTICHVCVYFKCTSISEESVQESYAIELWNAHHTTSISLFILNLSTLWVLKGGYMIEGQFLLTCHQQFLFRFEETHLICWHYIYM